MLTLDTNELQRRAREWLCQACAQPLPEDSSAKRMYCSDRCRKAFDRFDEEQAHFKPERGRTEKAEKESRVNRCEGCTADVVSGARGPLRRFCDDCRKRRHRVGASRRYGRKGYPKSVPNRQKYKPGWTSPNGQLTLVRRIEGDEFRAWFACACGSVVKVLHIRNVKNGVSKNCAVRDYHPDPRTKTGLTYSGAHGRKKRIDGSAGEHDCFWGCGRKAEDWAYFHADHSERAELSGREAGRMFSEGPEHYVPMCKPCHARFDSAHRRLKAGTAGVSGEHVAFWHTFVA